jgi:hypothetical protein
MLFIKNGARLADFESPGGRADCQIIAPQDRRMGCRGDHVSTTMAKSVALFIQNFGIPASQRLRNFLPIALDFLQKT